MFIEIYGFAQEAFACPACMRSKRLCEMNEIEHVFYPIVTKIERGQPVRDLPRMYELCDRLNKPRDAKLQVPAVFVDGVYLGGLTDLRMALRDLNYNVNEVL